LRRMFIRKEGTLQAFIDTLVRRALERRASVPANKPGKLPGGVHLLVRAHVVAYIACGWDIQQPMVVRCLNRLIDRFWSNRRSTLIEQKSTTVECRREALRGGCRSHSFSDGILGRVLPKGYTASSSQLYQLSRLGRALPYPDKATIDQSLNRWVQLCTDSSDKTLFTADFSDRVLETFQGLASRYRRKTVKMAGYDVVGHSACLEFNRKEGGRVTAFVEHAARSSRTGKLNLRRRRVPGANSVYEARIGNERKQWVWNYVTPVSRRRYEPLARKFVEQPLQPSHGLVPVGVPELGNKVRVVTKSPAHLVSVAHSVRKVLYGVLKGIPQVQLGLDGSPPSIPVGPASSNRLVVSADMSGATDTMYHPWLDLCCSLLGIDPRLTHREMTVNGLPYTRGCPMGLPVSWLLLSLTHFSIAIVVDPQGRFCIRGDDLIAYWTKVQWETYRLLCEQVGFVLNLSKSFRAKRGGTFCEELYRHSGSYLRRVGTLPVRLFAQPPEKGTAPLLSLASTLETYASMGCSRELIYKCLELTQGPWLRFARSLGVHPALPVAFGGLGFPPREPHRRLPYLVSRKVDAIATGAAVASPIFLLNTGRNMVALGKCLSKIHYRVTDNVNCPHLPLTVPSLMERAAVADLSEGRKEVKSLFAPLVIRQCARSWNAVPLGRLPDDAHPYFWSSVYRLAKALRPTPESLWRAGHSCDSSQWRPNLEDLFDAGKED